MNAIGFEYDGLSTLDFGLIICSVDSSDGINVSSAGSEINFNTVSSMHGNIKHVTNTTYDSVLEANIQICKYDCDLGVVALTIDEKREISRWLNRKEPHILKFISKDETYDYAFFEGSFNISEIQSSGDVIGYELHLITNRPFAIGQPVFKKIVASTANYKYRFYDVSDEVGYIYPKSLVIKCLSDGDLTIHNAIENRTTQIKGCKKDEVITCNGSSIISSSLPSHNIPNDFNFRYFRIANSYENRINDLTISIPCEITFEYVPIVKGVGL